MNERQIEATYLQQIGRIPLLNAEEEVENAKAIEAGLFAEVLLTHSDMRQSTADHFAERDTGLEAPTDEELRILSALGNQAFKQMIEANLRIVIKYAHHHARFTAHMKFLDFIQEGNIILGRAVEKFNYTKGFKFSTYVTQWISKAMQKAAQQQERVIRLPEAVEEWYASRKRHGDADEDVTTRASSVLIEAAEKVKTVHHLDAPVSDDGTTLGELISSPERLEDTAADTIFGIEAVLRQAGLDAREIDIMRRIIGVGKDRKEMKYVIQALAKNYNISSMHVYRLRSRALEKLRDKESIQTLREKWGYDGKA